MITWVSQSVSYRVLWHSVHLLFLRSLSPSLAVYVCGLMDGGGHTANRVLLDSLCKTLVSVYICIVTQYSILLETQGVQELGWLLSTLEQRNHHQCTLEICFCLTNYTSFWLIFFLIIDWCRDC